MLSFLRNRVLGRPSRIETPPVRTITPKRVVGSSPSRGVTKTPIEVARLRNRSANRVARASRSANR
jgi:hypothetical protein